MPRRRCWASAPTRLRSWERRFGYPTPRRTAGGHRQFDLAEIEALRQAFEETHNVSSAISIARERGSGPSSPVRLRSALRASRSSRPTASSRRASPCARSSGPSRRCCCRPSTASTRRDGEARSAELGFALRWATGLARGGQARRPAADAPESVLIFDASWACDIDSLHAQALELCLRRAGVRTLMLTAELDAARLTHVLRVLSPRLVVLTGRRTAWLAALSRIAYQSRRSAAPVDVLEFRGALTDCDVRRCRGSGRARSARATSCSPA